MRCPVDNETLVMADRNGVEIDYCPKCRGVWLDRGELDKIIERGMGADAPVAARPVAAAPVSTPVYQPEPRRDDRGRDDRGRDHRGDQHGRYDDDDSRHRKRRKDSFLGDLFDF